MVSREPGLVTAVTVNETPLFTTATFANATVTESRKQRIGANAGIEASVRGGERLESACSAPQPCDALLFTSAGTDVKI